jgi:hypothetical protein
MDKIEAARKGQGFIELKDDSADRVKQTVEKVSRITGREGKQISFEGHRMMEGHGFGLEVNCYDIYECPGGYLLHVYMNQGSNWAVAGKTLKEMLATAPNQVVAKRAYGELVKKNLVGSKH